MNKVTRRNIQKMREFAKIDTVKLPCGGIICVSDLNEESTNGHLLVIDDVLNDKESLSVQASEDLSLSQSVLSANLWLNFPNANQHSAALDKVISLTEHVDNLNIGVKTQKSIIAKLKSELQSVRDTCNNEKAKLELMIGDLECENDIMRTSNLFIQVLGLEEEVSGVIEELACNQFPEGIIINMVRQAIQRKRLEMTKGQQ